MCCLTGDLLAVLLVVWGGQQRVVRGGVRQVKEERSSPLSAGVRSNYPGRLLHDTQVSSQQVQAGQFAWLNRSVAWVVLSQWGSQSRHRSYRPAPHCLVQ